jgi:hydroxypyruvate isomerase
MLNFAANLSFLFTDRPFKERFVAAKNAGFDSVEYLFPYDYPAQQIKEILNDSGLEQALFNAFAGDWDAGERGLAALVGRESELRPRLSRPLPMLRCWEISVYTSCQDLPILRIQPPLKPI